MLQLLVYGTYDYYDPWAYACVEIQNKINNR